MRETTFDIDFVASKLRFPAVVVLGRGPEVAAVLRALPPGDVTCYQMDLFAADRLEAALREVDSPAKVVTRPDLWDLSAEFRTAIYPAAAKGERALKVDMVEQAFHVLQLRGHLLVLSPYETETFFPKELKKVFGRFHAPASDEGPIFWSARTGERARRRHEATFHVRTGLGQSLRFLSRPGVFAYGRFDDGARALTELMHTPSAARIIDIGCGCGTNGIIAAKRGGTDTHVTFVDSNLRAVALAAINAHENGVANFDTIASSTVEGISEGTFDVALANPPYFAEQAIAALFVSRAHDALKAGGRLYLVTKRVSQVAPLVEATFGNVEATERRGYVILEAER